MAQHHQSAAYIDSSLETSLRKSLRDIAAYWDTVLPSGITQRLQGTIGATSDPAAPPVAPYVLDARAAAMRDLHFYCRVVLDERSETYEMPDRLDANDVAALCAFLEAHIDWLAQHELGDAAEADLAEHATKLYNISHPNPREQTTFVGPCQCGARVHAPMKATMVTCGQCKLVSERRDLHRASETEARDKEASVAEIAATAWSIGERHITEKDIRDWAREYEPERAHLNPHPLKQRGTKVAPNGRTVATYRIGDVYDRCDIEKAKREAREQSRSRRLVGAGA